MTKYIVAVEYPHGVETFGPFATVSFSSVVAARRGKGGTAWVFNDRGDVLYHKEDLTRECLSRALHPSNWPRVDDA